MDIEALETEYRILYWDHNELQIVGAWKEAAMVQRKIDTVVNILGYVPAA